MIINYGFAQTDCDSAWQFMKKENVNKIMIQNTLKMIDSLRLSNDKCVFEMASQAVLWCDSIGFQEGYHTAIEMMSVIGQSEGRYSETIDLLSVQLENSKARGDSLRMAELYYQMAYVHKKARKTKNAFSFSYKSAELASLLHNLQLSFKANLLIGSLYTLEKEFNEAESYYNKCSNILEKKNEKTDQALLYLALGSFYARQKQYEQALLYYTKSRELYRAEKLYEQEAKAIGMIASVYNKLRKNRFDDTLSTAAERLHWESLRIRKKLNNAKQLGIGYNNLGTFYSKNKKYQEALRYFQKSTVFFKKGRDKNFLYYAYLNIATLYDRLNMKDSALANYKIYVSYMDSVSEDKKDKQIKELQYRYKTIEHKRENERLESENAIAKAEIEKRTLMLIAGFVVLALVIALAGYIYRMLQQKKAYNKELEAKNAVIEDHNTELKAKNKVITQQNEEKSMLMRELNHRMKNNLQMVSGLLNIQALQAKDKDAAAAIKMGKSRVEAISKIHNRLFKGGTEHNRSLNLEEYLDDVVNSLAKGFSNGVAVSAEIESIEIDMQQATSVGLIINELITNAFKYAFKSGANHALTVKAYLAETGNLDVVISDTGEGFPENFKQTVKRSFGMGMIESLTKQLKGEISFYNDGGGVRKLTFPLSDVNRIGKQ